MICNLSKDIIMIIFKKLHRFNYLDNLLCVNKELYNISTYIYTFHYYKINKFLHTTNIDNIYRKISESLFNNKILNIKKINKKYLDLPINTFVKLLIIFNEYFSYNVKFDYIKIISYKELLQTLQNNIDDLHYIPFIMYNLNNKFYIFIEFCYNKDLYRLRIKSNISNTRVGMYKNITQYNILDILNSSKNQILTKYV